MLPNDQSAPVELHFSGRDIKSLDYMSKADSFVKVFLQTAINGTLNEAGRTETINNSANPDWKQKVPVEFFFEVKQPIRFQVYDEDSPTVSKLIGKVETILGHIMGSPKQQKILEILNDQNVKVGTIVVRAEKIQSSKFNIRMKWRGGKIANMDSYFSFWDKSDPYLKFLKIRSDGTTVEAARSDILMNNQEPDWKLVEIPSSRLVSTLQKDSKFKVQCWDFDEDQTKHKIIGFIDLTIQQVEQFAKSGKQFHDFPLSNPNLKNPGTITLQKYEIVPAPHSFIDYVQSGLQLSLAVGIDFTSSNVPSTQQHIGLGATDNPQSLHFISNQPNQYQKVLRSIWEIIQNYDSDRLIPALGFGGIPHYQGMNQNTVNHCFPITGSVNDVEITGLDKLLDAYVWALKHVALSGPTHFGPIITTAFKVAQHFKQKFQYQILLILTDGWIHDMQATKDIIISNAHLPMSIIIVGIGSQDFQSMFQLSGEIVSSKGVKCPRDIIQFVPFNKFGGNGAVLTKEILRKIPEQVVSYMELQKKEPEKTKAENVEQIVPVKAQ